MNIANAVTLTRIFLIPLIVFLIYLPSKSWAAVVFGLVALTDWLDGWLARRYNLVTTAGKFLDPLADKLLTQSVLIVLAVQLKVEVFSVLILTARELAIMGLRVLAADKGIVIAASKSAKYKTALQMVALFLLLADWPFGLVLYYVSFLLALYTLAEYFWQNRRVLE